MTEAIWPRLKFEPGGRNAEFEFLCYATEPVPPGATMDLRKEGCPSGVVPSGLGVRTDSQAETSEPLIHELQRESLLSEHPELESAAENIQFMHLVVGDVPDPGDLSYLQAAWAAVRWYLRHGAFAVRDVRMEKWRTREAVLRHPSEDPTLACGWRVLVEDEVVDGFGHLAYTRGMSKFGRPDLITAVPQEMVGEIAPLLNSLALNFAEGRRLPDGGGAYSFEAYVPGVNAPPRDFFNEEVLFLRL